MFGDMLGRLIIFLFFSCLGFFMFYNYSKERKLYSKANRLSGEIISFGTHREGAGYNRNGGWTFYDMEVLAENGKIYKISEINHKAGKYKDKKDITIFVNEDMKAIPENCRIKLSKCIFYLCFGSFFALLAVFEIIAYTGR